MNWSNDRLDEFAKRMDERFDRVDERFIESERRGEGRFEEVGRRFDETDRRFDETDRRIGDVSFQLVQQGQRLDRVVESLNSVQSSFVLGIVTLAGGMMAGFGAILVLIATRP